MEMDGAVSFRAPGRGTALSINAILETMEIFCIVNNAQYYQKRQVTTEFLFVQQYGTTEYYLIRHNVSFDTTLFGQYHIILHNELIQYYGICPQSHTILQSCLIQYC